MSCTNLSCWFCLKDSDYVGSFPPCDTFEEAAEFWNRRAVKESEWTNEVPTEEGYYSVAYIGAFGKVMLQVQVNHNSYYRELCVKCERSESVIPISNFVANKTKLSWSRPMLWLRIPTPPLPGREGK